MRGFKPDSVPRSVLDQVLEAGRLAPSAVNYQPYRFIVVEEEKERNRLAAAYPREWFRTAPAIIVVVGDTESAWKRSDGRNYVDVDCAIAVDHMTLAAADLGYGTCWVGAFDPAEARRALGLLDDNWEPLAFLPLGMPDDTGRPKERKPLEELVRYGLEPAG